MTGILDSIMAKPQAFLPESVAEYTALQLAKKLGDANRVWNYVSLLDREPLPTILEALSSAQAAEFQGEELITAFQTSLDALTNKDNDEL
jgi:hypothetical protein